MRRLPIYMLIDTSESMAGEPIKTVRIGLNMLFSVLERDSQLAQVSWLSAITFGGQAQQVCPLTEFAKLPLPVLSCGGQPKMVKAFELLLVSIDAECVKKTLEHKGDWKPVVLLMTNDRSTEDWSLAAEIIQRKRLRVSACAPDASTDAEMLSRMPVNVIKLCDTPSDKLRDAIRSAFFWFGPQPLRPLPIPTQQDIPVLPPPPRITIVL